MKPTIGNQQDNSPNGTKLRRNRRAIDTSSESSTSSYHLLSFPLEGKIEAKNYPFQLYTLGENKFSITTKNYPIIYQEHKFDNLQKQKNKFKIGEIDKLLTFEEILKYGIESIKLKDDYLFNRIRELKELCDCEEEYDVSLDSLKTMFIFVEAIGNISKPSSLTVSESGLFYLEWERDKNNSITVRFKKDYFLDYVIFKPSLHIDKRIIFNGSMYALDLVDFLKDLNLKIHQQI
ncbi:MAG: hypothetical protein JGK17_07630 [Microcoleus sp. PH2017_10_PVI_O_A]|uniref:hypothetical protein n=1 Tax=unclassified Microcoleus TaxID=2642155 RepID=UPI001E093FE3|nr:MULTISPECIES: hypothetical protein [unclassified Microcoleus]TAE81275.1 MAG: hypothetical protein EAZ83_15510 [Oscillatoriales cyanobacterium]MCC3405453.1 hypothetical protein [Microcoleus sp. PH2017_10_PVI_O_A]MCC3459447.1 hypothetical protein [Microcoleus sp. PH2017_11_PCY_U_A]MCC3477726.1 hypothetical protein [Microcoleus sp. PH2017_12_PCY_D_A]MCC3527448.1 hypothetical protein [Microcoleus sp. PH2017_21_RUC_O_A]